MNGGTFGRCELCGRLLINGQRCVCGSPPRTFKCDCTSDGNDEHTGPRCRERERRAWAHAMGLSRIHADHWINRAP